MSIFNCNLKYTRIESNSLQSTKNKFIVNGFMDKYNNILNLTKFRLGNKETSEQASAFLGKKVRVFEEEIGGNKALPMFEVFKEINRTKIINKARKEKFERLQREKFQEQARLKQLREGYDGKEDLLINTSTSINLNNLIKDEAISTGYEILQPEKKDFSDKFNTSLVEYNSSEAIWSISENYNQWKEFKDKNKELTDEDLLTSYKKYIEELGLEGRENINLDCI